MRHSPGPSEPTRWDNLLAWLDNNLVRRKSSDRIDVASQLQKESSKEAAFVLLNALYDLNRELLTNDIFWEYTAGGCKQSPPKGIGDITVVRTCMEQHEQEFSDTWPIPKSDRDLFLKMIDGRS